MSMTTQDRTKTYDERLDVVRSRFAALPRGAKMAASQDLLIAPSLLSGVVNDRWRRDDLLAKLEEWLETASPETIARRGDVTESMLVAVDSFAATRLVEDPMAVVHVEDVYAAYVAWANEHGVVPLSMWRVVARLRQRWPLGSIRGRRVFAGISLEDVR